MSKEKPKYTREEAMMAAGFCLGISYRQDSIILNDLDRKMLNIAGIELRRLLLDEKGEWKKE